MWDTRDGCNWKWESLLEKSKQKRHGFHGYVKKFSIMYWGRRTGLRLALLLNFGTRSLQFKRIIR
jgi:hypothetical protein